jgi:hypothetical protein
MVQITRAVHTCFFFLNGVDILSSRNVRVIINDCLAGAEQYITPVVKVL